MDRCQNTNFIEKHVPKNFFKKEVWEALPLNIRKLFMNVPLAYIKDMEEIRLRTYKPLMIGVGNKDFFIGKTGDITPHISQSYIVTKSDIEKTYQLITDYSVYALEEEIKNGFLTIKGGHRVGICGRAVLNKRQVKTMKDISGLNIRISKEKLGISQGIMSHLVENNEFHNTLIISPPQCGKTTLLRDIIRNLSNGMKNLNFSGFKVGVVDERSEICGIYQGVPQNDVGIRTDILDACPKAEGMMMLIRSMSPQVIATDEIGKKEDIYAIEEALNAGINLITTVHGKDMEEIMRRPNMNHLLLQGVFKRIIILTNQPKVGTIRSIVDGTNNKVLASYSLEERRHDYVS
ncbi:stage III sporulation protein AA [Clostridiaceae bacterium 35-E11]